MQTYSLSTDVFSWLCTSISQLPVPVHTTLYIPPNIWNPVYHIMCAPLGLENVH